MWLDEVANGGDRSSVWQKNIVKGLRYKAVVKPATMMYLPECRVLNKNRNKKESYK